MTVRLPGGKLARRSATRCWRRRRTRLRTTAPPTRRPTTNPTLAGPGEELSSLRIETTSVVRPARRPRLSVSAKSGERRSRAFAGSMKSARSGGKLGAPFAAAGSEDGPTCSGTHPEPETVGFRSSPVIRLKGALAHCEFSTRRAASGRRAGASTTGRHSVKGYGEAGPRSNGPRKVEFDAPLEVWPEALLAFAITSGSSSGSSADRGDRDRSDRAARRSGLARPDAPRALRALARSVAVRLCTGCG
jgi:hypothetical protein